MEKGEMGENATGHLTTYYVAECMEFNRYGEYREDIHSAEEAVKIYQSIPSERLNAGKGVECRKRNWASCGGRRWYSIGIFPGL